MRTKFELISDEQGHCGFVLKADDGSTLLRGVAAAGRSTVQTEIAHVRKAVKDVHLFVPHRADDGAFVVLKDRDGSVLAKTPHVPPAHLLGMVQKIRYEAPEAPVFERHIRQRQSVY
jgi:uncharacterized protein YegP (UPF0339 family)